MKNLNNLYNKIINSISKSIKSTIFEYYNTVKVKKQDLDIDYVFDIECIDKNILKKQYCSISFDALSAGFGGPSLYHNGKIKKVYESAIKTYSVQETIKAIKRIFGFEDWQIRENIQANDVKLIILYANLADNTQLIIDTMEAYGWSYAISGKKEIYGMIWNAISFDPIFQDAVNNEIKLCSTLYHWTPNYLLNDILQYGLIPKNGNSIFSYPPKIHLIKGLTPMDEIINIGSQLCGANENPKNDGNYNLLKVDTKKIPYQIDYFYDPRYEYRYYTKNSICKEALEKIMNTNFKKLI